jgi:Bax inhibitor 1
LPRAVIATISSSRLHFHAAPALTANACPALTLGIGAATVGAWTHTVTGLGGGFLAFAAVFGLMFWILLQQDKDNTPKRLALFTAFGFAQGMSIGGLVDVILAVDASIAMTALAATTAVFACFSGFSLLSRRRSMLYLGGILGSALSWLLLGALANAFLFRSAMLVGGTFPCIHASP